MAVIALISAKGSPGVTTTSLAMTLAWPRPVMLVEADPAGGDILAGYLRGQLTMDRGLVQVAVAARHNRLVEDLNAQLLDLAKPKSLVSRVLLSGLADPAQAATVAPTWEVLAAHFARLAAADSDSDVILDCGRLATNYPPLQLMAVADAVLLVVRSTLRSASTAKSAITATRAGLGAAAADRLGLIVVDGGEYRGAELGKALHAPVVATIPWRPSEAAALSDGIGRVSGSSALLRAARGIDQAVRVKIAARQSAEAQTDPQSVAGQLGTTQLGTTQLGTTQLGTAQLGNGQPAHAPSFSAQPPPIAPASSPPASTPPSLAPSINVATAGVHR